MHGCTDFCRCQPFFFLPKLGNLQFLRHLCFFARNFRLIPPFDFRNGNFCRQHSCCFVIIFPWQDTENLLFSAAVIRFCIPIFKDILLFFCQFLFFLLCSVDIAFFQKGEFPFGRLIQKLSCLSPICWFPRLRQYPYLGMSQKCRHNPIQIASSSAQTEYRQQFFHRICCFCPFFHRSLQITHRSCQNQFFLCSGQRYI